MSRYRDIKSVVVFGNSWTGVQDVNCPLEADSFDYSGDDNTSIRRVDVTKQSVGIDITVQDPSYKRDISSPVFGSSPQLALNEVLKISMGEKASEIVDSSEDDDWITFVGITKRVVEADVELRDFSQIMTSTTVKIGDMGKFQFDVLPGAALTGLADRTSYERFHGLDMTIVGISPGLKHGDLHSGSIKLKGGGDASNEAQIFNTTSDGQSTVFEIHAGDSGTISFTAPSADGGADVDVSIENCVCTSVDLSASHGGRLERKFSFKAYSSDGQTSPISLS
ncbi:MAG: hypothetical protein U9P50_00460 [Patescibacteria group bacterium]|nr:hypothetical protein [Patescibacteria group bacterium]